MFKIPVVFLVGLISLPASCCLARQAIDNNAWTGFRGAGAHGHSTAEHLPSNMGDEQNLAWKSRIPGRGWSSPVIIGDEIWMTTSIEIEAAGEELEKKMAEADIGGMSAYSQVDLKAICVHRESGEIQKVVDLFSVHDPPLIHSLNSFASPTPVVDDLNVYAHFGTFGTAAINRKSGVIVWKTLDYPLEHQTGPGSSPILHNGLLILHCDGCDLQYVVALDAETGREVWRTDRSGEMHENPMFKKAFSTPIMVKRNGIDQLISPAANWIYGYDPQSGEELWKLSYGQLGFSNVAQPIVRDNTMFICSCFMQSRLMAIDFSGAEPITDANVKWTYGRQVPNMPSPIEIDGLIFIVSDRGIATCLNSDDGEVNWQARLGGGFSSSPLYADGRIYVGNQDGQLFVIRPNPEKLETLAMNQLDSQIMASPAAIGQALFVRTRQSLYCFQNQPADGISD